MTNNELPTARIAEVVSAPTEARWLVRGLCSREAVGLIGGIPKSCKSWFGLDLAVSIASGTPCLGRFAVEDRGPTLVYLAEDALPLVRERVAGIAAHRGLDLARLDVHAITAPSLRLDQDADQARLRATLDRLRPKLLLLDPLVRLHTCDENSSQEIAGLLGFLRDVQRSHQVAVILVHHLGKKNHGQLGQGLRGSGDLHAWGDDNAYLTRKGEDLLLTLEHRSAPAGAPIKLRLAAEPDGTNARLEVIDAPNQASSDEGSAPAALDQRVIDALARARGPITRAALRAQLRVNSKRLGDAIADLEHRGLVERTDEGCTLRAL